MSSRGFVVRATLAVALLAMAAPLAAQDAVLEQARLRARIDSLTVVHAAARAAWDSVRAAERRARLESGVELDTQRIGPLTLVSTPRIAPLARRSTEEALESYGAVAQAARSALDSTVLLVDMQENVRAFEGMRSLPNHRMVWLPRWRPDAWRRRAIERHVGLILAGSLPPELQAWLSREGVWAQDDARLARVHRSLAADASPAADECREGAVDRCWDALGLGDAGAHWERWYTPRQLVGLALSRRARWSDRAGDDCERERSVEACAEYLAGRGGPPPPLAAEARASLLTHVVATGGAEAWRRLATDSIGTARERLVAASGVSADSLISSWRRGVLDARPRHSAGLAASWLLTMFWVVVVASLAMRSTRWRLG